MTTQRQAPTRRDDRRRQPEVVGRAAPNQPADAPAAPPRRGRKRGGTAPAQGRETRAPRSGPRTATTARAADRSAPPKNTTQARARAKARKAKAPKVVRPPLRERLLIRLASLDLSPRALAARVPFVVLIIGSLGVGLGITLWLSTDAAERSYQLGNMRAENRALLQQKESLERDVLAAESAPALAEAARNLGMIPSRDTAHLVQDPIGNWVVVGSPKPAEGVPPPPLNAKLPEEQPAPPPPPRANPAEVPTRVPPGGGGVVAPAVPGPAAPGPEVLLHVPNTTAAPQGDEHLPTTGPTTPGPQLGTSRTGPAAGPVPPGAPPAAGGSPTPATIPVPALPTPVGVPPVNVERFSPPAAASAAAPSVAVPGGAR